MGNWAPSIVPAGEDQSVYLVADDFGDLGRCWRETDVKATDLETVISDMLDGQYNSPVRVIGFNTAEGWSRDVSSDVAAELRRRCDLQLREVPENIQEFAKGTSPTSTAASCGLFDSQFEGRTSTSPV
jgi:hypothetical protein